MTVSADIFTKRGITPPWERGGHVAREQGFVRYEGATWRERRAAVAEVEPLFGRDVHPDPFKSPRQWTSWLQAALSVDGWVMQRHAPMPDHEDSDFAARPVAQLRPDVPVFGHSERHHHHRLRAEARGREEAAPRTQHEAKVCDLDAEGNVLPTGHLHPHTGEVVVPREGWHSHWKHAKYLYTPGNTAKRLGASPLNVGHYAGGLFVVVMEGTLKMCAVTEANYPCIDAGSVTLWGSESPTAEPDDEGNLSGGWVKELHEFAERYLGGRTVAVVCDSDWYANPAVRAQTEKVAEVLRPLVKRAVACAPPEGESYGWRHPIRGGEMRAKRGVDDWLGEHPREERHDALLELVFYEKIRDAELAADDVRLAGFRSDGAQTTVDVVRAVGEMANPADRVAPFSVEQIAARLGRPTSIVKDARARVAGTGLLDALTVAERKMYEEGGFYMEPPLVRVAEEGMPTYERRTLREWVGRHP